MFVTFPGLCCGGFGNNTFNGLHLFDVNGTVDDILSVTINPSTIFPGFSSGRITFDANNVYLNFSGLNPDPGTTQLSIDVTTTPEPTGGFLMAGGVAMFFAVRGRKYLTQRSLGTYIPASVPTRLRILVDGRLRNT